MDRRSFLKVTGLGTIAVGAGLAPSEPFKRISSKELIKASYYHDIEPALGPGKRWPDHIIFMYRNNMKWLERYDLSGTRLESAQGTFTVWKDTWPTSYWAGFVTVANEQWRGHNTKLNMSDFNRVYKSYMENLTRSAAHLKRPPKPENMAQLRSAPEYPWLVEQGMEDAYKLLADWDDIIREVKVRSAHAYPTPMCGRVKLEDVVR